LTVEFGPSRSKRFRKAVEEAESGAGECSELEPGSYRVRFVLGSDGRVYTSLARLLERVRNWRATELYEGNQLVSSYHACEMGWCASFYLSSFGECRERFGFGVLPRCGLCPLFDSERAIRAGIREEPASGECSEAASSGDDFELLAVPDFTNITNLDFLFFLREQLELAPQGCKAAGLDLDQQVAADEVDDETAGDLLEQVAGTAVPFLQLRVERALVERPDLHDDAPSAPVPRCLRPH
jgi:hypothetical protein